MRSVSWLNCHALALTLFNMVIILLLFEYVLFLITLCLIQVQLMQEARKMCKSVVEALLTVDNQYIMLKKLSPRKRVLITSQEFYLDGKIILLQLK